MRTFIAALGLVAAAALLTGCSDDGGGGSDDSGGKKSGAANESPAAENAAKDKETSGGDADAGGDGLHTVVYKITGGSAKAKITYYLGAPDYQRKEVTVTKLPWTQSVKAGSGQQLALTVGAVGDDVLDATVGCAITLDGKEADKESTAKGDLPMAQCTVDVP